ncbi:hypothetical protein KCP70_12330 [Salmonella enterica subsp. enterica]|nr:hypothetical protein KCP70_12330 [Salmonella enterica subsp. enterica]
MSDMAIALPKHLLYAIRDWRHNVTPAAPGLSEEGLMNTLATLFLHDGGELCKTFTSSTLPTAAWGCRVQ